MISRASILTKNQCLTWTSYGWVFRAYNFDEISGHLTIQWISLGRPLDILNKGKFDCKFQGLTSSEHKIQETSHIEYFKIWISTGEGHSEQNLFYFLRQEILNRKLYLVFIPSKDFLHLAFRFLKSLHSVSRKSKNILLPWN